MPVISGLFCKVHLDMMVMPQSASYRYIVQARCALTAYPEWWMLHSENASTLAPFIFEDILCHWGALAEIVTDNGPAFVQALDVLADQYNIRHIRISPYNSQANGVVKRRHLDVREAITKSTPGGGGVPLAYCHSLGLLGRACDHASVYRFVSILYGSWHRAIIFF